jgi:hypothetical protein
MRPPGEMVGIGSAMSLECTSRALTADTRRSQKAAENRGISAVALLPAAAGSQPLGGVILSQEQELLRGHILSGQ